MLTEHTDRPTSQNEREPRTDDEWADYYQAHRDEIDEWEEVPSPIKRRTGRPSRGLSATITVRFTPEEAHIIYRLADEDRTTLSEIVREAVRSLGAHRGAVNSSPTAVNPANVP